jgi:hypothetical protein
MLPLAIYLEPASVVEAAPIAIVRPLQTEETQFGPSAQELLLGFSGSYTYRNNELFDSDEFRALVTLGYFATRSHEFGLQLLGAYQKADQDVGGGSSSELFRLSPYYNFNWYTSPQLSFFVGPHFEFQSFEASGDRESDFGLGIQGGVRYWISTSFGIEVQPRFTYRELGGDLGDETELQWLFGINLVLD